MRTYPIAAHSVLSPIARRGLRRRVRSSHEMLLATACEILVYRVNGEFVLDHGSWGPDHPTVLKAAHVSLVDMSVNKPVIVDVEVPTGDAGWFTVRTTFLCTVTDPATVVAAGWTHAAAHLERYLRGRMSKLGYNRDLDEILQLRGGIESAIAEVLENDPPAEPGMHITLSDISIRLPEEVTTYESNRRALRRSGQFTHESATYEHIRTIRAIENDHEQRTLQQQVGFDLAEEELRQKRKLGEEWGAFELTAVRQLVDEIGEDPQRALYLALVRNGLSVVEFTDRLREHATYTDHRRAEHDHRVRNDSMQVLGQRLNVLTKLIEKGQFDSIGVDSEKMDLLFAHFVEEVAALASVPVTELPPVGAFDYPNEVLEDTGDNT
ncbi:hypothetical protein ABZ413_25310 [Nocardia rhamnosiphila]|uniref:hypothetical protein n=1 Tax=Nocardia rhamnosiphila TaxID=426716 RepID=UPI00340044FE